MSDSTRTTSTPAETVTERHPVRGFFWGFLMGLGLAIVAVVTKLVSLSLVTLIVLVVVGVVVGVVWGLYGPAKPPKGPAPGARVAPPEATRFDDFDEESIRPDPQADGDPSGQPAAGSSDGGVEAESDQD